MPPAPDPHYAGNEPREEAPGAGAVPPTRASIRPASPERHDTLSAEERLRWSDERYRILAQTMLQGVVHQDADGTIIAMNPAAERILGHTREDFLGSSSVKEEPNTIREDGTPFPGLEHPSMVALRTGREVRGVLMGVHNPQTHERRWISIDAVPVFRPGETKPAEVYTVFDDVTERRRAERELAEAKAELERTVRERTAKLQELISELEHFSYTITHDMRAPLRAIKGYGEVVTELCATCPQREQKEYLARITAAAERMDALIRDALSYSQAVHDELPLERVDVDPLVRGMLDSYPEFQATNAAIRIDGKLPAVLGNAAGLTQCFSNLFANAVKFVEPGKFPEVRVWAERIPPAGAVPADVVPFVRFWVEDHGIGIPDNVLPRVFEMFTRANRTHEGTGIGLALVRKVVDRMGGRVGAESRVGVGSRFWIELQAADSDWVTPSW